MLRFFGETNAPMGARDCVWKRIFRMIERLVSELKSRFPWIREVQVEALTASREPLLEGSQGWGDWQAYRMVLHVSEYRLEQNTAALEEIAKATLGEQIWIEPLFLSTQESEGLKALGEDEDAQILCMLEGLRAKSAASARRYAQAAMDEILRVLWLLEQEFTTTGLHTWLIARKLELLFVQLVRWGFAFEGRIFRSDLESWEVFQRELCGEGKLFPLAFAAYPLQIRSFVGRHNTLSAVVTQSYGENDLEIDQLMHPLQQAAEILKKRVRAEWIDATERTKGEKRRRLLLLGASASVVVLAVVGWLWLRPPYFSAVSLPTGSSHGGITGRYYTGQNFDRYVRQRADYELNFSSDGSPMPGVPKDHYSVRWEGYLEAPENGTYELCVRVDDGARLYLHRKMVINEWRVGHARTRCRRTRLQKGWHPLRIEFFERGWMAILRLLWKTPSGKHQVLIPSQRLCCR